MGAKQNDPAPPASPNAVDPMPVAEVAVALPVWQTFSYAVPAHLTEAVRPGVRVLIPFGSRRATGYVLVAGNPASDQELRPIEDVSR